MAFTIHLERDKIMKEDLSKIATFLDWNPVFRAYITKEPGEEPYKLISYITKQVGKVIEEPKFADIGTYYGSSALAAAAEPRACITTYDITNHIPTQQGLQTIANIPIITRKMMSAQLDIVNIAKSDIIYLDITPHDGIEEMKIINALHINGFKGIMFIANLNKKSMREMWDSISEEFVKHDVSSVGHWLGTGIIVFDKSKYEIKLC